MISRRHAIGSGVALSALAVGARATITASAPTPRAARVAFLIVDERFDAARTLSRSIAAPTAQCLPMPRDVLDLWHRHLATACRTGTVSIAGVTTERGFFLLRTLAADQMSASGRLRVLSRATHGALVSWVIGPK